jgi:transcriptional regulator with XRE-family HTH domain
MDNAQLVSLLERLRGDRYWKELAAEMGVSESFLSRVRRGQCGPGPKILAFLKLEQKTVYTKAEQV